eukprot:TRINITY_DN48904_c0_g1_i1.p1 TRINITY_DN48904_c0_g1~~TRINITY_DN48904_c0_g1_i1.p1  ORF type:complete len:433 (-),score=139.25 TRINITY_DN48904_c0_g1_i1:62-1360(-)
MSASGAGAKRRIGGHFGAALGASTKKQKGGWREEAEDEEEAKVPAGNDSDSDAPLDPGTPLPSEEEEEAAAPAAAAETQEAPKAEAEGEGGTPTAEATAENGKAENGDSAKEAVDSTKPAAPAATDATNQASSADASHPTADAVALTLDLVVGPSTSAKLRVLLLRGLDKDIEDRLAACAPPKEPEDKGGRIDFLVSKQLCGFAGHDLPGKSSKKKPTDGDGDEVLPPSDAAKPLIEDPKIPHSSAGLLTAPLDGPGLALTLGPQPDLDGNHRVVGHVLVGRRAMRRLEVLVPVSGEAEPKTPIFLRHPAIPKDEEASRSHPFITFEPTPAASASTAPFAEDDEVEDAALTNEEILDLADVELKSREEEVADLKQMGFSRQRQNGVINVETALTSIKSKLTALEGLDDTASGQRFWLEENCSRLLRVLNKLH